LYASFLLYLVVRNLIYFLSHCHIVLLFAYLQFNVATYFFLFFFFVFTLFWFATAFYYFSLSYYFFPLFTLLLPVSPFVFLSLLPALFSYLLPSLFFFTSYIYCSFHSVCSTFVFFSPFLSLFDSYSLSCHLLIFLFPVSV
jgi:hypothetical protein